MMVTEETLKHYRNKITYAQNREDLLLESFFYGQKLGFYVDVGGYDPDEDSVTKLFYLQGWHGINIEPQPKQYQKFMKHRSRDININCAIGDKAGSMQLRIYRSGGLSTLSDIVKEQYSVHGSTETATYHEVRVKVERLDTIFRKYDVPQIDFMKVDIEGYEEKALRSNDWSRYRPRVLCIESGPSTNTVKMLLQKEEYIHLFNDGLNDYYSDLRKNEFSKLAFIDHLLIRRGGGIRSEDYRNIQWLFRRNKALQTRLEEERIKCAKKEEKLSTENIQLRQLLNDERALLRKSLKMYARKFKGRLQGGDHE